MRLLSARAISHGIYPQAILYLAANIYVIIAEAITRFLAEDILLFWEISSVHSHSSDLTTYILYPFTYSSSLKQPPHFMTSPDPTPLSINPPQPTLTPPNRRRSHRTLYHRRHRPRMTHREPRIRNLTKPLRLILTAPRSRPSLSST